VPESVRTGRQPGGWGSAAPERRRATLHAAVAGPGRSHAKGEAAAGADRAVVETPVS
jgi:hypothetical protein